MLKALYFPHTEVQSDVIIKNALLLWDAVETIVPRRDWKPVRVKATKIWNQAVDLIVQHRVPSLAERNSAHTALAGLVESGVLNRLLADGRGRWIRDPYLIYPEKFLDRTWHLLERGGMAEWVHNEGDYGVPSALGFLMMSILADACAGTQIQKITDRVDAYNWIAQNHAQLLGSQYVTGLDISQVAPAYDRLVTLSLEVLDARRVPLEKLIKMRVRELKTGGSDYSALRRRYLHALQSHIGRVAKDAKSATDLRELERQFKEDIKQDLSDLKSELGLAGKKALLSKEVALGALIAAGSLAMPITGLTALPSEVGGLGVVPLTKALVEYRGVRREVLRKHTMSWLYLASRKGIPLR